MKIKLTIILALIIAQNIFAQTKFMKGYFTNNSGNKIDCLIKSSDWKNNPTEIEYKISEKEAVETISINQLKEFEITNVSKFIKETVDIDTSKDNLNSISNERAPEFIEETILLKVLVDGINSLYLYDGSNYPERFFYKNSKKIIEQLVYKKFYDTKAIDQFDIFKSNVVGINEDFKKQLYINVSCSKETSEIEILQYKKNSLTNYFLKTNLCLGDTSSKKVSIINKTKYEIKPLISFNTSSVNLTFDKNSKTFKYDLKTKKNLNIGFEAEVIFPFDNYQWSAFIQPSYNTYEDEIIIQNFFDPTDLKLLRFEYNFIQIPVGLRRSFLINKKSKIYCDAAANIQFSTLSNIFIQRSYEYNLNENNNLRLNYNLGIGYCFSKLSFEYRFFTKQELSLLNSQSYKYLNSSIVLKYNIL